MSNSSDLLHGKLVEAFEQSDNLRRKGRVKRTLWLSQHQIAYGMISGPMDTMTIIREATECFVEAHNVAALLLAVAFIEHTISNELCVRNLNKSVRTLKEGIQRARENNLFPIDLLSRADKLREIRNPFSHRKPEDHQHNFGNRFLVRKQHPDILPEEDAKEAMEIMYAFFHHTLESNQP